MPLTFTRPYATLWGIGASLALGWFTSGVLATEDALIFGVICLACIAMLATVNANIAFYGSLIALVSIPLLAVPVKYGMRLTPGIAGLWITALVLLVRGSPLKWSPTVIDVMFLVLMVGLFVSIATGVEDPLLFLGYVWLWVGAYLLGRAFAVVGKARVIFIGLAIAGIVTLPATLYEVVNNSNVFLQTFPGAIDRQFGVGIVSYRLDHIRIQGAFGNSLPFGVFLALSSAACLVLWLTRDKRQRSGHMWLIAGFVLAFCQISTYSRTGYLLLLAAAALLAIVLLPRIPRYGNLIVPAVVVAILGVTIGPIGALFNTSGQAADDAGMSQQLRKRMIHRLITPGSIPATGTSEPIGGGGNISTSIDNAYLDIGVRWGYLPLLALMTIAGSLAAAAFKLKNNPYDLGLAALGFGCFVSLFVVTFLQQQQVLIWLIIGGVSGALARRQALRQPTY